MKRSCSPTSRSDGPCLSRRTLTQPEATCTRPSLQSLLTTAPTEDPDDAQQYIADVRRSLLESKLDLSTKPLVQTDIPQNVKEIRAILQTNAEIFHRCIPSAVTSRDDKRRSSDIFSEYHRRRLRSSFARIEVNEVHVQYRDEKTVFVAYPKHSEKSFHTGMLSYIPSELESILKPTMYREWPHSNYIDHEAYFRRCLVLHDDILGPFLVLLKEYLMSVQVCMGEIDEWIMESNEALNFLQTAFGDVNVKEWREWNRHDIAAMLLCHCPVGKHQGSDICLKCKYIFSRHVRMNPKSDGDDSCRYKCPDGQNHFHCNERAAVVLKECSSFGRHETKFSLFEESQRNKLQQFLEYISS